MPEILAASPDPACFCLHFESGIEENQPLAPDLFAPRAPAPAGARTRKNRRVREADGRFAKGHSGNPGGRPRGIPNPKRRVITLRARRENREAVLAVTRRKPWLFRSLVRQVLPPARPIDPAERIGLRIASVRTPEQVWRALDKALQAASRGPAARRAAPQSGSAGCQPACRPSGSRPSGLRVGAGGPRRTQMISGGSQSGATDQIHPADLEPAHEDRSRGPIVTSREEDRRFPARQKLVDHEPDLGLGWHTNRRRGIGFLMQIFAPRVTPLPKPDRAVSAFDAGPEAGLLVSRIDNRFDVMWLKAPVRRQQSGVRVREPNRYLAGKGKSS
jgi:hypothetical protein